MKFVTSYTTICTNFLSYHLEICPIVWNVYMQGACPDGIFSIFSLSTGTIYWKQLTSLSTVNTRDYPASKYC